MAETCRILVTGSRTWTDWRTITGALIQARDDLNPDRMPVLVQGCAAGADFLAAQAARKLGWPVEDHPADWNGPHGKRAGFIRNAEMVALGADVCLCFVMPCVNPHCSKPRPHDSHGASLCAGLARAAGIPVRKFTA